MSAQFLHKELPVRLAHRVTELEQLPYGLSAKAPVLKVTPALTAQKTRRENWCGSALRCFFSRRMFHSCSPEEPDN
jgi:hypothetical protein